MPPLSHPLLLGIYASSIVNLLHILQQMLCILQVADSLCSGTKPTTSHVCNGGTHCTFCSGERGKCSGHGICSNVKGACVCDTGYSVSPFLYCCDKFGQFAASSTSLYRLFWLSHFLHGASCSVGVLSAGAMRFTGGIHKTVLVCS